MSKIIFFLFVLYAATGCSNGDTTTSPKPSAPMLQISWTTTPDYHFNLFITSEAELPQGIGNYFLTNDTSIFYKWQSQDIQLTGMALWDKGISYGYSLKASTTGQAYLYNNNKQVSLNEQDVLIATPQNITCGTAETQLSFQHGMSKIIVLIEQSQVEEYQFSTNLHPIMTEGYIDLINGNIKLSNANSTPTEILYLVQETAKNNYSNYLIPQTLSENANITIMGMKGLGEKVLNITKKIPHQVLKAGKQYTWKFTATKELLKFDGFTEEEWK